MWQMHNKYHREGAPYLCLEERKCLGQEKKTILENDWWVRGRGQPRKHSGQNWEHWCDPLGAPSVPTITTNMSSWQVRVEKSPTWVPPAPLFPLSLYHFPLAPTHGLWEDENLERAQLPSEEIIISISLNLACVSKSIICLVQAFLFVLCLIQRGPWQQQHCGILGPVSGNRCGSRGHKALISFLEGKKNALNPWLQHLFVFKVKFYVTSMIPFCCVNYSSPYSNFGLRLEYGKERSGDRFLPYPQKREERIRMGRIL